MQGRVDAGLSLAFTRSCGPQASLLLLLLTLKIETADLTMLA